LFPYFFGLLLSAWVAEIIGVHAFFGAFFFGLMLPKDGELTEFLGPRVELLIVNDWHESISIAILIQARGLVSLITANVGYQAGIFNSKAFSAIVLVTILTMCMASPVFYSIYEKYLIDRYAQLEDENPTSSKAENGGHDDVETGDRPPNQLDYEKEKEESIAHDREDREDREESVAGEDETPTTKKVSIFKKCE